MLPFHLFLFLGLGGLGPLYLAYTCPCGGGGCCSGGGEGMGGSGVGAEGDEVLGHAYG